MKNLKTYCITINNSHLEKIKKLNYLPVGLGNKISSNHFLRDNSQINISNKNSYYGEYTFHYWLWKNKIDEINDSWIGFCQYRKHWSKDKVDYNLNNLNELNQNILTEIPNDLKDYESILGEPIYINQFRLSKFIKKNFNKMIRNPSLFFDPKKRNIKFHFDMMHGNGNLDKAIKLLEPEDRKDFENFVNLEVSFNPHNMFICKSNIILKKYYNSIFPWLERCEKNFGFDLEGYGLKRIYGFLAERYMSYWFKKYTKHTTLPIIFKDISELD
ncbi:DUF4422 domain-containing protein [Pelagibacteraceae bacterium]|nr:DUF4422 domain-containing protein [Pelagibacteraceae bacterium]